jgi:DNA-binding IclR family transcriptional regulator
VDSVSGIGVLDKAMAIVAAVATGPLPLAGLVDATGIPRPTAHRLAVALEAHGLVRRDAEGRFVLGLGLLALGRAAADAFPLAEVARPVLAALRDETGESAQLYVRDGDERLCVAAVDSGHELRTIVAVGARLPLAVGSAGRVLTGSGEVVASVAERAPGVASVSAPVHGPDGNVVAAVSVSGPIERTTTDPGQRYGRAVTAAARRIEAAFA